MFFTKNFRFAIFPLVCAWIIAAKNLFSLSGNWIIPHTLCDSHTIPLAIPIHIVSM